MQSLKIIKFRNAKLLRDINNKEIKITSKKVAHKSEYLQGIPD
jgi:hypothetical protein